MTTLGASKESLRYMAFAGLLTLSPLAALAGVSTATTQMSVHSDARNKQGTSDPKSAGSTGAAISVSSNVFVAQASASSGFADQPIIKGRRFGGNGLGDGGTSPDG